MDTLDAMATFVRAVDLGSLTASARERHTTQPTVSKAIAALERHVGVRLLDRSTARLVPTEEGQRFLDHARRMLELQAEAIDTARGQVRAPSGLLRLQAPLALGHLRVNGWLLDFLRDRPALQAELRLDDRFVDLAEDGVDAALRLGGTPPPHVVARRVGVSRRGIVASPAYLAGAPRIRRPDDLSAHGLLRFNAAAAFDVLTLTGPRGATATVSISGRYRVVSSLAIREALVRGAGPGLAPDWLVQDLLETGDLVRVLPAWHGDPQHAWLLMPALRYRPARARLLVDALVAAVPARPGIAPVDGR